jgi:hypothetical protein
MLVFWIVTQCEPAGRYRRFGKHTVFIFRTEEAVCSSQNVCIYLQVHMTSQSFTPEDGDNILLRNTGIYLQDHMALQPFAPEDGDSIFLRNACIYLQVYTELQPSLHGVTTQRTKTDISTVRTSTLIQSA